MLGPCHLCVLSLVHVVERGALIAEKGNRGCEGEWRWVIDDYVRYWWAEAHPT